jgi:predicted metal-dependent phosphoesterase TrpH
LVRQAKLAGVTVLALTDHDTDAGWDEAAVSAAEQGIALIRGAEISTTLGGRSVHLLSYLHDPAHPGLRQAFARTKASRLERLQKMTALISADFPISWPDVVAQTQPGASVGRPHIADALVAAGVVADRDAAFANMLRPGSPYYTRYEAPATAEMVAVVRQAGGVPVLAHPFATRGRHPCDDDVAGLVRVGLLGLEVWHREQDEAARQHALALTERFGLWPTGSSDYHGFGKPNRLGENYTSETVFAKIAHAGVLPVLYP